MSNMVCTSKLQTTWTNVMAENVLNDRGAGTAPSKKPQAYFMSALIR